MFDRILNTPVTIVIYSFEHVFACWVGLKFFSSSCCIECFLNTVDFKAHIFHILQICLNTTLECLKKFSNGDIYDGVFLWK